MAISSEDIQTLILTTLDTQGSIENTDSLKGPDGAAIPYLAVVGVLNSLASKEVCASPSPCLHSHYAWPCYARYALHCGSQPIATY